MLPAYITVCLQCAWCSPRSFPWVFLFSPRKTEVDAIIIPPLPTGKPRSHEFSDFPKAALLGGVGPGVEPAEGLPSLADCPEPPLRSWPKTLTRPQCWPDWPSLGHSRWHRAIPPPHQLLIASCRTQPGLPTP